VMTGIRSFHSFWKKRPTPMKMILTFSKISSGDRQLICGRLSVLSILQNHLLRRSSMQLLFINASPRGKKSNTGILMGHFIRGFLEMSGNTCEVEYLVKHKNNLKILVEKFSASDNVIVGFPLYID